MSKLDNILKQLAEEITVTVTKNVRAEIRGTMQGDVTAIVKDELNKNQVYQNSGSGFLTITALCEKYKISRKTVTNKCKEFKVERKQVGKQKLVNEAQFLTACEQPSPKLAFLKKD